MRRIIDALSIAVSLYRLSTVIDSHQVRALVRDIRAAADGELTREDAAALAESVGAVARIVAAQIREWGR